MDIYAREGTKVAFKHPTAGYQYHQDTAKKHLQLDHIYTIDHTEVENWHTDVFLKEVPGVAFNSCHFDDAVEQRVKDTGATGWTSERRGGGWEPR